MATCGPRGASGPPVRLGSRIGLVASARTLITDRPFVGGIEFDQQPGQAAVGTYDPFADHTKAITESAETVQWDPFAIWTGEQCSTFGGSVDESAAVAAARLERQTTYLVEEVVWTNFVNGVDYGTNHPNIGLADAAATDPNTGTIVGLVTGFSDMIRVLNDSLGSERGMIHVDQRLLPFLAFYGLVIRDGNLLLTALADHIVVAGAGYTGSDPATPETPETGTTSWIYGTGQIELVIGPVDTYQYIDQLTNTVEARAERPILASWDTSTHFGLSVCLPDPGPECPA